MKGPIESDAPTNRARQAEFESLFQSLLAAKPEARHSLLGELCAKHPQHAGELGRCLEEYSVLSRLLSEADGTGGSLAVVGGDLEQADAWEAYLAQLRSRTGAWSRYVVEGEIARGGMGVIYKAIDRDARRRVALKVMRERSVRDADSDTPSADPRTLGRFLEEAQVHAQLDHPGIAPVHEIGIDSSGRVYFTMKLVKGEDFQCIIERISSGDPDWNLTRGVSVLLRTCEAMSYAHAKGVLHRDLKPSNIMVGRYGEAYVMDWGLARVLGHEDRRDLRIVPAQSESVIRSERHEVASDAPDSPLHTMDGDVVGTPAYMSPEQAFGRIARIGPASDVYSMGAILYHLLTGRMPYLPEGARLSARAIHARVMQGPPEPIASVRSGTPPELVAICEKAMEREIERRYGSMEALASDLRAHLERRVVRAYETGLWAELRKLVSRNRAAAAAIGLALVVTLVITLVSMQTLRHQRNEATALAQEKEVQRLRANRELDQKRLEELQREWKSLFPLDPAKLPAIENLLEEARQLHGQLPDYERALSDEVAELPAGPDPRRAWVEDLEQQAAGEQAERRAELLGQVNAIQASIARYPFVTSDAWRESPGAGSVERDGLYWAEHLQKLCEQLRALDHEGTERVSIPALERYLDMTRRMDQELEVHRGSWEELRAELEDPRQQDRYAGLDFSPWPDLVPLGRNAGTELHEFWHVPSGERPERNPGTGDWRFDGSTGIVFVLIPAAKVTLGSQSTDRQAPNWEARIARGEELVTGKVGAFLIARTELTQGQWLRLAGRNPSTFASGGMLERGEIDDAYPLESVSAARAVPVLERFSLRLPFDHEWEYACRAGTETAWWFPTAPEELDQFEVLLPALEGAALVPDRVGRRRHNAFGMHDMAGNVRELCGDRHHRSMDSHGRFMTERYEPGGYGRLTLRGGSYAAGLLEARSARILRIGADEARCDVGIRPVYVLARKE